MRLANSFVSLFELFHDSFVVMQSKNVALVDALISSAPPCDCLDQAQRSPTDH